MTIDLKLLQINVNLHSLQPGFLNHELHYIIASDENRFRFATWDELPEMDEKKYYCFLLEKDLLIPAGNISLNESYVLTEKAVYPIMAEYYDFISVIESIGGNGIAKGIRCFSNENIDEIKNGLEKKYGEIHKHIITSDEAQHLLLILNNVEISVSETMVYFRPKAPFSVSHYNNVKE